MLIVYTAAIVLSALLLFLVQPMMAKMVLPQFGGSPSVWNTCMLFFQTLLLAGYVYAHALTRSLRLKTQVLVHLVVLILPIAALPIGSAVGLEPFAGQPPVLQVLVWLLLCAGAPFFVLATSAPLLQRWFAATDHPEARDPYFLYAASNAGSVAALLAYPSIVEPTLRLATPGASLFPPRLAPVSQSLLWSVAYLGLVLLVAGSGILAAWRRAERAPHEAPARATALVHDVSAGNRLRWVVLAFVPSSAMLGATQFLTSEIAAVPLLWVAPLLVYLLTYIFAFSRRTWIRSSWSSTALALLAVAVAGSIYAHVWLWAALVVPLHLLLLFAVGLVCHGRLARIRPASERLTQFYLMIALGGALGGVFNAIVAPLIFDSILEYPLVLVAACLLRPDRLPGSGVRRLDLIVPGLLALLLIGLDLGIWPLVESVTGLMAPLRVAVPALFLIFLISRRLRFALSLAVLLAIGWHGHHLHDTVLHTERTFYGIHTVFRTEGPKLDVIDPSGRPDVIRIPYHTLTHGPTNHGTQALNEQLRSIPTTYYHRSGPIGQILARRPAPRPVRRIGVIGLGVGTLAAYGRPKMHLTYYEIDPEVVRIARDPLFFTYLRDSHARIDVVVGDGRLSLAREPDGTFDLIVLDAFSSDSIPVHLITREAVELYMSKLAPDGLLALHLTVRYLDLLPVVEAISRNLGLVGLSQSDSVEGLDQVVEGKVASKWAVLARRPDALGPLLRDPRWHRMPATPVRPSSSRHLWTDDYSNILGVLKLD